MNTQFLKDVEKGLNSDPKFLSSKYFYDKIGDDLFVQIMNMPEYYLTRSEYEIFSDQSNEIIDALEVNSNSYFELIELGAGDGIKTKELLKELLDHKYQFDYIPVDISQNALDDLEQSISKELPGLNVKKKQGTYFEVLKSIKTSNHPKVILFLGSNIGNLSDHEAHDFLDQLASTLNKNDKLLLGVDQIKSRDIVLPAYNDSNNITAKFNLNLLNRINKEFNANFDLDSFNHLPEYTEQEGIAKSYLVSTKEQAIYIKAINTTFNFSKGEKIHTEISRKYNDAILEKILSDTEFEIERKFTDTKKYFADYIINKR